MSAQKKKLNPFSLFAGAGATITSMTVGSFLGDSGTLIGAATGSVVYGVVAVAYENVAVSAHSKLKKPSSPDDLATKILPAVRPTRPRPPWQLAVTGVALAAAGCSAGVATMAVAETISGKTLHGLVSNTSDYGSTLGGHTGSPPPAPAGTVPPRQSLSPSAILTPVPSPTVTTVPVRTQVPSPTITADPGPVVTDTPVITFSPSPAPATTTVLSPAPPAARASSP